MKILMVRPGPNFSVADVHNGWRNALVGLGCELVDLNYDERLGFYTEAGKMTRGGEFLRMVDDVGAIRMAAKGLEAVCYEWWPDVVIITSGFYIPLDTLDTMRMRGHKVVLLHTESPYEDDRQLARAEHVTLNVLNDPTNLDRFRRIDPAAMYLPHCYDPTVHYPAPPSGPDVMSDFCFVGTGYRSRIEFLERVDWTGIDVALAGNWVGLEEWDGLDERSPLRKFVAHDFDECCENTDAVDLYRGAKASANLYRREADRPELSEGWAMGPREVELAATGCFYLTEPRGENRLVLPMIPTFDGPGDFGDKLRWYLEHADTRCKIADQARAAIADRTFTANAAQLLTAIDHL